ncbi:hypothetical protein EDC04DRAFT_2680007 [Pisolithus marmoratus]|nr:hypothetical protein EDC04DRAFT_2680007 [Pisolithus marmoratus]
MSSDSVGTMLSSLAQSVPQVPLPVASAVSLSVSAWLLFRSRTPRRTRAIAVGKERVLILGATSGVGRVIAQQYALRGAYVCVLAARNGFEDRDVNEMVKVRESLEKGSQASPEGIQHAVNAAQAAVNGNYLGPLVTAVTFIPLLTYTSPSPSILLLSSAAAVIPPPTRSIYASTKCASLMLYQALQIEHPSINFTFVLPATIEGDFRASAVDNPRDWSDWCIRAIDRGEKNLYIPYYYRAGQVLYWFWPALVEWRARVKYNFRYIIANADRESY